MSDHNGASTTRARGVARNMTGLVHDAVTLSELQAQLLKIDAEICVRRSILPLALMAGTLGLTLGCVPIALATLALVLVDVFAWPIWAAFLVATATGIVVGGVTGWIGWRRLQHCLSSFTRSAEEFQRNVRWAKRILKSRSEQD